VPEGAASCISIADVLEDAVERLERSGVGDARREATALWAAVAGPGVKPGDVWLARERHPDRAVAERFRVAVERRSGGVPFGYAVGRASFRQLELKLDQRALIPRPETEGLVELVLRTLRETGNGKHETGHGKRDTENGAKETWGVAADVGTGCGCIALSLAVEGRFARVIAVERSPGAAALARENVALVRPSVPVEVREGSLLAPLAAERCRVIVANPPYLTDGEYAALDPAVRSFEPREALVSGSDGLDATRELFAGAARLLEPGGVVAVEIDARRAPQVRALAREHGWRGAGIHEDLFGRPRYLLAHAEEEG
jgi:release factor glutamine methyltransferase